MDEKNTKYPLRLDLQIMQMYFSGILAITGTAIPGDVYAWTAVFILPLNSALNPFLYTLSAILGKKVSIVRKNRLI